MSFWNNFDLSLANLYVYIKKFFFKTIVNKSVSDFNTTCGVVLIYQYDVLFMWNTYQLIRRWTMWLNIACSQLIVKIKVQEVSILFAFLLDSYFFLW